MKTNFLCFILIVSAQFPNNLNAQTASPGIIKDAVSAVVFPSAMNVLYIGVENPVQIAVPGIASEQIMAIGCGIAHKSGIDYVAKPQKVGLDSIMVTVKKGNKESVYKTSFRIRRIPDPYVYIGKAKGGTLQIGEFKTCKKIEVGNPDFIFVVPYKVISFEMIFAPKCGGVVSDVSYSNMFTKLMLDIAVKAKPGDVIVFQNVIVQMPDGRNVPLNTSFKIIS